MKEEILASSIFNDWETRCGIVVVPCESKKPDHSRLVREDRLFPVQQLPDLAISVHRPTERVKADAWSRRDRLIGSAISSCLVTD